MARPRRTSLTASNLDRTVERVAIAALAALATRASSQSIAFHAVTIFVIVVVVEEFGRRWIWHGKSVTLRDVALSTIGEIRLQRAKSRGGGRKRKRRTRPRHRRRAAARPSADQGGGGVQGG